ncbi:unnamed protein product [Paramecium sonneborni]|uniref:MtA protein n=1 Tax=Paramecium sonneborni TaxID=65129 RepID=A0A8S1KDB8_9CILI|nr:unnamed protein product [Paramecium sonneborni]
MFFAFILSFVQAFQMKIDDDSAGVITKYTFDVELQVDSYNQILVIFPISFEFIKQIQIQCWCNGEQYQVKSQENQIQILGDFLPSKSLKITLENIENGYVSYNNNNTNMEFSLEFYSHYNLVEKQSCFYRLSIQQQLRLDGRYENYTTFVKTTLHIDINFLFRVRSGTVLNIIFPIINNGANTLVSQLSDTTYPFDSNKILDYNINLNERKLTIFNLFEKQYLPGDTINLSIANIFTNNQQLDRDSFVILFQTSYKGLYIAELEYFQSGIKSVSNSREFILNSSNQIVSQKTQLYFSFLPRLAYIEGSQIYIHFLNLQSSNQIAKAIFLPKSNINPNYEFSIENEGLAIKNFNQYYESMKFEFCVSEIVNPTGLSNFNIGLYVLTPDRNLIEYQQHEIEIIPEIISSIIVEALNTTVFATTKITIKFVLSNQQTKTTILTIQIPQQIEIVKDSVIINPGSSQEIIILGQYIQFKNYFSNNYINNQIEIIFFGKLIGLVGQTDNFQISTNDYQDALISISRKPVFLTIKPSEYILLSLRPQIQITDFITNFVIQFQIPQIYEQSIMTLKLPQELQQQLSFCSASIQTIQQICQINDQNINVKLFFGGILEIIIYNIKTERSLQEYSYLIEGEITYKEEIQSIQQNQKVSYTLLYAQTFSNYSLIYSNLFYGELNIIQFSFNLLSTIHQDDLLEITFPLNIETILSCSNIIEKQMGNKIFLRQLQNNFNTISCELINPKEDIPLYPFNFNIATNTGKLIAQFQDIFGIRDGLRSNNIDFSIQQSKQYLNEETTITLNFFTNLGMEENGKIKAVITNSPLYLSNFNCEFQSNSTRIIEQEEAFCDSYLDNENLIIIVNFLNSQSSNTYKIIFNGLILQGKIGDHAINITLKNINKFGKTVEESSKQEKLVITCHENCENCNISYNQCSQCKVGFVMFQNQCITKCPANMISTSQGCESCLTNANCLLCDPQSLNKCIQCKDGFNLKNGYCIKVNNISNQNSSNTLNQSNTNNNNFDDNDYHIPKDNTLRKNQIYDGSPIFVILMSGMLLVSILNKLIFKQKAMIGKTFYVLTSLLEMPIAIIRFIRFALLQYPGYFLLSLSCLAVTILVQIINSSQLQLLKKTNLSYQKIIFNCKVQQQLATLLQWRIFLLILPKQCQEGLLNEIKKLFAIQAISQTLPTIVQISFICNQNQFSMFSIDDILYNSIIFVLSILKDIWLTEKMNSECRIHPEFKQQSLQVQEQILRIENELNQEGNLYYSNQSNINEIRQ